MRKRLDSFNGDFIMENFFGILIIKVDLKKSKSKLNDHIYDL